MGTVHRSYRLDEELVARVNEWAEAHGGSEVEAVRSLLALALAEDGPSDGADTATSDHDGEAEELRRELHTLKAEAEAWHDQRAMLGDHIRDLRETVSTLKAETNAKNEQIARLQDTVEHAQMLEAAHVAGTLRGTTEDAQPEEQPRGIWAWLARKLGR